MDALFSKLSSKDVVSLREKLALAEKLQILENLKKDYEEKLKDINDKIKEVKKGNDVDIKPEKKSTSPPKKSTSKSSKKKTSTASNKKTSSPPKKKNVKIPEDLIKNKKITVKLLRNLLAQNDVYFKTALTKKDLLALVIKQRLKTKLKSAIS